MHRIIATLLVAGLFAGCLSDGTEAPEEFPTPEPTEQTDGQSVNVVLGPDGSTSREVTWMLVPGTGNCCENYVASTAAGRIMDFGGTYIQYSDDEGHNWTTVETPIPYLTGEGAIIAAPGGDIVGVGWSPYSGDQTWGQKYDATNDEWLWAAAPVHTPVWDREWIVALPGPFTDATGTEVPYVTLARGGTGYKDVILLSTDGYTYAEMSLPEAANALPVTVLPALDADPDPERDWIQPLRHTLISPVGDGRGLHTGNPLVGGEGNDCLRFFDANMQWSCLVLTEATLPDGALLMDSTGTLHVIDTAGTQFTYHISHDGGRSWDQQVHVLPNDMSINEWDFKAHAALDSTIVAIHGVTSNGTAQDMVYRFNGLDATPSLQEILFVGDGGGPVGGGGVSNSGQRYDFMNTAFLPDGRVVLSIVDSRHSTPVLAVEQ